MKKAQHADSTVGTVPDEARAPDASAVAAESTEILAGPPPDVSTKQYYASIYPGPHEPLPPEFVGAIQRLEQVLEMPVWFLIQTEYTDMLRPPPFRMIDPSVTAGFYEASKAELVAGTRVALVVVSPGGIARESYRLATLLQRHCGGFQAVVPQWAKSASTLLILGAESVVLGKNAELGPLDAQVFDPDHEGYRSALNEYQSLERLFASAFEAVDQAVMFWRPRSLKKIDRLLPLANAFVADMMRPLFEKIDTVHYTETARILKEGEEYAVRLLAANYPEPIAEAIASALVEKYPAHDFVIDAKEASQIALLNGTYPVGLRLIETMPEHEEIFDAMEAFFGQVTWIGRLEEVTT